jgi:hypothetical protein
MLIALGIVDWVHAARDHVEVAQLERAAGGRHINADQTTKIMTRLTQAPASFATIIIDQYGSPYQREEQNRLGEELRELLTAAHWDVNVERSVRLPTEIGIEVALPLRQDSTGIIKGDTSGSALLFGMMDADLMPREGPVPSGENTRTVIVHVWPQHL